VKLHDSFPDLYMPIGFAGGLQDPATGFVRFGYRDYDPDVGRFTAPDPLGDTGGDHDLYDYCIDDPVNRVDPTGLLSQWVVEFIAKQAGRRIAASFFPKEANAPEEMSDVRLRIMAVEKKIDSGTATQDDLKRLEKDRQREDYLWEEYGDNYYYATHGSEYYRRFFPSDGYAYIQWQEGYNRKRLRQRAMHYDYHYSKY